LLVAVIGLSFIPFLVRLEKRLTIWFLISGLLFVGGALGVEILAQDMDEDNMSYGFATAIEEGMEMLGSFLFLAVNLKALQGVDVHVRFK
jgi:hypothetical protein